MALVGAVWAAGPAPAAADTIGTFQWARCADDGLVVFGIDSFGPDCLLGGGPGTVFAVRNSSSLDFQSLRITAGDATLASVDELLAQANANWIVVVPGFLGSFATLSFTVSGGLPPGYGLPTEWPQVDETNFEVALNLVPVPEPATLTFLLLGAVGGVGARARRRGRRAAVSQGPR